MPDPNKPNAKQPQPSASTTGKRTPSSVGKPAGQSAPGAGKGSPIGTIGTGQYVVDDRKLGFDDEGLHIPTGNSELLLSRRQLLFGAIGVAAVAAVGGAAASMGGGTDSSPSANSLAVGNDEVFTLDDCAETPIEDALALIGEYKLPYGSLVWAGNDTIAACLLPTDTAKPLVKAALLNITSGNESTVLEQADGQSEGFEIYDIRASDEGVIWTEANILTGEWRVFVASISMMALLDHHQVDSGDSQLETPTLAAIGDTAYWQVISAAPTDPEVNSSTGETTVRAVSFGKPADVRTIYTAACRCATSLSPDNEGNGVVVTPIDPEAKTHRKMLLVGSDGQVRDQVEFPSRMTPMEACYGTTGFAFSFESIYNYGDGISNLGTYTPREKPSPEGYSHREWFRFTRTPTMPPSWCEGWFMVKSTSAVVAVNLLDKRYAIIPTDNNAEVYGDCLASIGANGTAVTFTNIDRTEAVQDNEKVTENDRLCQVRVWATPSSSSTTSYDDYEEEE